VSVQTYPSYRDSGVDSLGQVPDHWVVAPAKYAMTARSGGASIKGECADTPDEGLYQGYSASGPNVWLPDFEHDGPGLVLSAVGARCGKVFKADGKWGVVANTHCLIPREGACRDFLWYLTNDESWWEKGGTAQPFVKVPDSLIRKIALPPAGEQIAIAAFLDRETAKIDALVAEQECLIALLKEKRQAVISHAVTKGLNPDAPMKDSGIEWLGEIPAHWTATTLRRCCRSVQTGGTPSSVSPGEDVEGISWFTPGDFKSLRLLSAAKNTTTETIDNGECRLFPVGSVLVVSIGATLGKVGIPCSPCSANQQINAIFPLESLKADWLGYSLSVMSEFMKFISNASTIGIMNQEKTKEIPLALPPLDEQGIIVSYLEKQVANFDALVAEAISAISLLQERRAALIAAAVTGKIDVRGLVALNDELEAA
jgi:type I restriction enzyme S subunit